MARRVLVAVMEATADVLRPAAWAVEAATAVGCRARAAEKRAAVANMFVRMLSRVGKLT